MDTITIQKSFVNGLRASKDVPRNAEVLRLCTSMRPTQFGLAALETFNYSAGIQAAMAAATPTISRSWPFPQFIKTRDDLFICTADNIYEVTAYDVAADTWTFTCRTTPALLNTCNYTDGDYVTNGTFTGGPPPTSWTLTGVPGAHNWTGLAPGLHHDKNAGNTDYVTQTSGTTLVNGDIFLCHVEGTAESDSTGPLSFYIGGNTTSFTPTAGESFDEWVSLLTNAGDQSIGMYAHADFHGTLTKLEIMPIEVPGGTRWQVADFGPLLLFYNGECTVFRILDGWWLDRDFKPSSGTNFNGRLILTGFGATDTWKDAWQDFWDNEASGVAAGAFTAQNYGADTTWWSTISGIDMLMHHLPDTLISGALVEFGYIAAADSGHDETDHPLALDVAHLNQQGTRRSPFNGSNLTVLPLKSCFIVYGDEGICRFFPIQEPYPQFGMERLLNVGIPNRSAVGGTDDTHIFVDLYGVLWRIQDKGNGVEVKRLGYEEYLADLVESGHREVLVEYDPLNRDFHITGEDSDGDLHTFILTPSGLCEDGYNRTYSILPLEGTLFGITHPTGMTAFEAFTELVDFGTRLQKNLLQIEVGFLGSATVYVHVYHRLGKGYDWHVTSPVQLKPDGTAILSVTGVEFLFRFEADDAANMDKLDYANIGFITQGKRSLEHLLIGVEV